MQLLKELEPQIIDPVTECLSIVLFYASDAVPDGSETRL